MFTLAFTKPVVRENVHAPGGLQNTRSPGSYSLRDITWNTRDDTFSVLVISKMEADTNNIVSVIHYVTLPHLYSVYLHHFTENIKRHYDVVPARGLSVACLEP